MSRPLQTGAGLGALLLASSISFAQAPAAAPQGRGTPPPGPSNLQVLPKDTPRDRLIPLMQNIAAGLGVGCNYCHFIDATGGGKNDFVSDEKPAKKTARQMMVMTTELNGKLPTVVGKQADATTRVGCMTCHRGVPIPKLLHDVLTETTAAKGTEAAVAQYRELRTKYFGAQAYDFSEAGLIDIAQRSIAASKLDEALTWLNLNLEFYPKSSRTYLTMAQTHERKSDKDAAVKDLEKALELDQNNQMAKQQLRRLKGQ
jgi:hypothetical protein